MLLGTSVIVGTGYSHGGTGHSLAHGSGGYYRNTGLSVLKRCNVLSMGQMGGLGWFIEEVSGLVRDGEKSFFLRCLRF